jgi:hypothetical protein
MAALPQRSRAEEPELATDAPGVLGLTIVAGPRGPSFPQVRVNGLPVPLGWGDNIIASTPGRYVVMVAEPWCGEQVLHWADVEVRSGQRVALQFLPGALPRAPGRLVRAGKARRPVLGLALCVAVTLLGLLALR